MFALPLLENSWTHACVELNNLATIHRYRIMLSTHKIHIHRNLFNVLNLAICMYGYIMVSIYNVSLNTLPSINVWCAFFTVLPTLPPPSGALPLSVRIYPLTLTPPNPHPYPNVLHVDIPPTPEVPAPALATAPASGLLSGDVLAVTISVKTQLFLHYQQRTRGLSLGTNESIGSHTSFSRCKDI